jgi:3-dehydroquinate synthase
MKQALILAAGRGARLDRRGTPKPLVEVGGHPIIFRLIEQLGDVGVSKVHVVLGYEKRRIRRAIAGHLWSENMEIEFHENLQWQKGSGFSVMAARESLDEPFLLLMGDHIFDDNLVATMANAGLADNAMVALVDKVTVENPSFESALKVEISSNKIVDVGWSLDKCDALDAGFFVATPTLFSALDQAFASKKNVDFWEGMKALARTGKLGFVAVKEGKWDDVDTPVDLVRAESRIRLARRKEVVRHDHSGSRQTEKGKSKIYDYVLGKPETVEMIVSRGAVASPFQENLIPDANASSPIFVFTDATVAELYGKEFTGKLKGSGYDVQLITLPVGEEAKTLLNYVHVVERVLSRGVDERSVFISLGGGVVCNVCGFVASTIYRGLDLVHVPTTLMAQCDAAISHKQAINGNYGKNMVGAYYSPRMVVVDVETLATLTDRQTRDGLAEVVKHGLGQDVQLAKTLTEYKGNFRDLDFLEQVIKRNIELKCELVRTDPKELRDGMVLQYGHTVGHPIEHLSGYSLYHGEAVAIGMMVAVRISRILGACSDELVLTHEDMIARYGLPTKVPNDISTDDILEALKFNKKYLVEGTRMALVSDVGRLWSVDGDFAIPVPDKVLTEAIEATRI